MGDFCLANHEKTEKILQKLNGRKFLIRGNHDKSCNGLERYFTWVGDIKEAKFTHDQYPFIKEGETFCVEMCHYPLERWNRREHGTMHLYGHEHGALDHFSKIFIINILLQKEWFRRFAEFMRRVFPFLYRKELRVDVGLDAELSGYEFISLEKVYEYARKIVTDGGCDSFQEYIDKLIRRQGHRK